jgi:hypothetical protein
VEDQIIIDERVLIEVVAEFVETMEAQDVFGMTSEMSFVDHVYGRSAIVYGGIQGGAHYNGVHKHNGLLLFQREVSRYKHNGEILFGSGLSDTFASDDLSVALQMDFVDTMPSRDELVITAAADYAERFSTARLYDSKMTHNGEYTFDAADDLLEVTQTTDDDVADTANIEDGELETELTADFVDVAAISEAIDPHTITLELEDGVEMDEELELSGNMDFSESAEMSDDFEVGMTGYWTYGDANNPKYTHDGSIGFNYGIVVPV